MFTSFYLLISVEVIICLSMENSSTISFDEFFDYTTLKTSSFSPDGRYLLYQTKKASWNTSTYENMLWLYDTVNQNKTFVTNNFQESEKPQWSPNNDSFAFQPLKHSNSNDTNDNTLHPIQDHYLYLYSVASGQIFPINIGSNALLSFTWSQNNQTIYLANITNNETKDASDSFKDVIQYRESLQENSAIYQMNLAFTENSIVPNISLICVVPYLLKDLFYFPSLEKLVFLSISNTIENSSDFEIYSIHLRNTSDLRRLTYNENLEIELKPLITTNELFFITVNLGSSQNQSNHTQYRLHSLNITDGTQTRWARNFSGNIDGYTIASNTDVYILGQVGTERHIYSQTFSTGRLERVDEWNGTFESITSCRTTKKLAFVFSSLERPSEIYLATERKNIPYAQNITDENDLFNKRILPKTKVYRWTNQDDQRVVEGILHYPPYRYNATNLPLLVLIHGGPYAASLNEFFPTWFQWATLAATNGWLVLEPNYRGSTGYGDEFLNEIRYKILSRPGKDILDGVEKLVRDGVADPKQLAVGGYSYGGFLTNWLITKTKCFNAALSGSGVVDQTSAWGNMDLPIVLSHLLGGFPWDNALSYQQESPIYHMKDVQTPTHIVTGEIDVRVPSSQSYLLERSLHHLGVPTKLLVFPNEGHSLSKNPWHGRIKVREELKWLLKYQNQRFMNNTGTTCSSIQTINISNKLHVYNLLFISSFLYVNSF